MQWVFPRTRERELAWKMGAACFFGSLLLSPFTMLIFQDKVEWSWFYVSIPVIPLILTQQKRVKEKKRADIF